MKQIPGFSQYSISDSGEVIKRTGLKLQDWDSNGYRMLKVMSDSGLRVTTGVHRLVALAHIGLIPKGMWVNHKNGIKHDNRAENLEITTPRENLIHSFQVLNRNRVRGEGVHTSKLTPVDVAAIRASSLSQRKLGLQFGVSQAAICHIMSGKTWKGME